MAGLLDLFGGGGGGRDDDPYADILTPGQRSQMTTQGLLAMAGAFADAGMPSRLPIPFGSALGKAAAALGTGQEAAMTSALAGAYRAQQIRDLRAKAALQAKLNPLFQQILDRVRGGGSAAPPTLPLPEPGARPAGPGALPQPGAAPAADAPLMIDQPYPAGGGLLGPDIGAASGGGLLGEGSGRGSSAADLGAGGDDDATPARGPTSAPSWAADPLNRGLRGDTTGQSAMDRFRSEVFGGGGAEDLYSSLTPRSAGGTAGGETPEMTRLIEQAAAQQRVSPDVLRGLIKTESNFNPNAVSPQGARGLAQLMPATARGLGVTDPTDPDQAIPAGARYLREGLDASGGDINKALMYYHGGPNQAMWGPRTQAYPGAVLAAAGGSGGSTEPDPYANLTPSQAGGAPLAAPGSLPGLPPPSSLPPLVAPGSIGAPSSGGKIPGLNMSPQELAVIDAMAEAAGLGNPFKGLLDTYYKSPGYLQESAGATAKGRLAEEEPSQLRVQASKARFDFVQKLSENALTLDKDNNVVEIPGMREKLGLTAGEIERAKEEAKAKFAIVDAPVLGPNGQPTTEKMTMYDFAYRQQQRAARGGQPQPGDIVGTPQLSETQKAFAPVIAKAFGEQQTAANAAAQEIKINNESLRLLDKGIYSGWDAPMGLALGRIFGVSGKDPADQVKNTQLFVLQRMQQAAQAVRAQPGSASDKDVAFANRMSVGDITLNSDTIREGLEIHNRFNREKIRDHNANASQLDRSVTGGIKLTVEEPPVYERQQGNTPGGNTWTRPRQ